MVYSCDWYVEGLNPVLMFLVRLHTTVFVLRTFVLLLVFGFFFFFLNENNDFSHPFCKIGS